MFEAKTTHGRTLLRAVREAVGQLLEYRKFIGPTDAELAILLEEAPDSVFVRYVEEDLEMLLVWWDGTVLRGDKASKLAPGMIHSAP